jgi:outer membrane receptor protein involved in Fe transport
MKSWFSSMSSMAVIAFASTAAMPAMAQQTDEAVENGIVDEVVITVTRREQAAQDVPMAVSVVTGDQIENGVVADIMDLQQLAPSLKTTTGQSAATGSVLSIRGIGTAGDNPGFEPAVGVFIDGVFRARAGVALADLPPIERVEVLRGPQGTLFGRNTSAGAMSVVTAGPQFSFGGYGKATFGNEGQVGVNAGLTGPISEQMALRLDAGYRQRDGYIQLVNTNGETSNNIDRYFVRGQAALEFDDISIRLIADMAKTRENCCYALNTGSGAILPITNTNSAIGAIATGAINALAGNPAAGGATGRVGVVLPFNADQRRAAISPNRDLTENVDEWGVSGEVNWDLGNLNFTSITAYRDWSALRDQDIDFSGLDRAYRDDYETGVTDFTQEFRLQGDAFDGAVDWLIGGFYLSEELTLKDTIRFGTQANVFTDSLINGLTRSTALPTGLQLHGTLGSGVPLFGQVALATNPTLLAAALANPALLALFNSPIPGAPAGAGQVADRYTIDTEAFALFTHNLINLSDDLTLTVGLRYNTETKEISSNLNSVVPACSFFLNPANAPYVTALQGAGLLGAAFLTTCNPEVNSEFNGVRSGSRDEEEFTGTLRLSYQLSDNVLIYGGFDRGYKSGGYNLSRSGFDSVVIGGNGPQINDLAFEFGVKSNPSRQLQLNATLFRMDVSGYQSNRFLGNNFVVLNYEKLLSQGIELEGILRPAPDWVFALGYTYIDATVEDPAAGSDNNRQTSNTPQSVVTAAMTWTPQLSNDIGALVHIDARYNSEVFPLNDPVARPFTSTDAQAIVNARVGLNFSGGRYKIEAFAENLLDEYYNITAFPIPEQGSSFAVYPSPPRYFGLRLAAEF